MQHHETAIIELGQDLQRLREKIRLLEKAQEQLKKENAYLKERQDRHMSQRENPHKYQLM